MPSRSTPAISGSRDPPVLLERRQFGDRALPYGDVHRQYRAAPRHGCHTTGQGSGRDWAPSGMYPSDCAGAVDEPADAGERPLTAGADTDRKRNALRCSALRLLSGLESEPRPSVGAQ
jgi:hypothetical protein